MDDYRSVKVGNNTVTLAQSTGQGGTLAVGVAVNPGHEDGELFVTVSRSTRLDPGSLAAELEAAGVGPEEREEITDRVAEQMPSRGEDRNMDRIQAFNEAWELAQEGEDPRAVELLGDWGWSKIQGEDAWVVDWLTEGAEDSGLSDYQRPARNAWM